MFPVTMTISSFHTNNSRNLISKFTRIVYPRIMNKSCLIL